MSTTLAAGTATSGAALSSDTSGILVLQSGSTPTTAMTIGTNQVVNFANTPTIAGSAFAPTSIANGTSNVTIASSGGSISVYPAGTENGRFASGRFYWSNSNSFSNIADCLFNVSGTFGGNRGFGLNATDTTTTADMMYFQLSGSNKGYITSTSSGTTYNSTSDYRLKTNVQPMTGALDKVAQLKPVTYTWIETGIQGQGFIAHELQAVIPEAVTGNKDDLNKDGTPKYQGIDTSFVVATLTAAIQELEAKVTALQQKVGV